MVVVLGGRFGDYIRRVNSRLLVPSRLAMCRFGLAVVISNILVILIRMQTSFAVVVSGIGLNVKQRTYSSGACATEYYSCNHSLYRPGMPSEVWCCG